MKRTGFFQILLGIWLIFSVWPALAGVPGTQKWAFNVGAAISHSPALGPDGSVYIGVGNKFHALNPGTGVPDWTYDVPPVPVPTTVTSSPTVGEGGTIYFGTGGGQFYALRPTGAIKWNSGFGISLVGESALGAGGYIYTDVGRLARMTPEGSTGSFDPGASITSPLAIGPDGTIYVGTSDNKFYALNPNLTEKWASPLPTAAVVKSLA